MLVSYIASRAPPKAVSLLITPSAKKVVWPLEITKYIIILGLVLNKEAQISVVDVGFYKGGFYYIT